MDRERRGALLPRGRLPGIGTLGPTPVVLLAAALIGFVLRAPLLDGGHSENTLVVWTSAEPHVEAYREVIGGFENEHGVDVRFRTIPFREVDRVFRASMWAGRGLPDLIELPQEKLGTILRGPADEVGFVDLTDWLGRPGPSGAPLAEDVLPSRLDAYRYRGTLVGIPHDVHPVALAYRWRDFADAGIDPDSIETWEDFLRAGRALTRRADDGEDRPVRYMLAIDELSPIVFQTLLLQRGGNWYNADGTPNLDDPLLLETLRWYIEMAYGPERIADGAAPFPDPAFYQAIASGYYVSFICPDWLTKNLEVNLPGMAGELRLMPLPAWEKGGRRTSTWGATMIGVLSRSENREIALALAEHLYASPETAAVTFERTNIISPVRSIWDEPVFDEPRRYWGNRAIGSFYLSLAEDVPLLRGGPFPELLLRKIADVIGSSAAYYQANGWIGFDSHARALLRALASRLEASRPD